MPERTGMELNRRDFVAAAGIAAAGVALLCQESALAQTTQPSTTAGPIDCGPKTDFAKPGPTMTWVKTHHIIVMNENDKLYAMTSRCTHHRCDITNAGDHFLCKCHHSDFKFDGTVIDGPAKRPLIRYGIAVDDGGNVQVNTHEQFQQDEWDDPKSFVAMSAA
ncbi:MAG TPA: Rieske (2Fe-2S) protein [Tepidisphaeraceae bacterium]|nr:Rieske (2Fe-2S) protein [Tepidisphaeraceae bacterium]